jgi:hypothetical protein
MLTLYFCFYATLPEDAIGRDVPLYRDELILRLGGLLLMFGPHLFDFAYTLNRRLVAGHSPATPHREHLYQRLVMAGYTHAAVFRLHLIYYTWNALMAITTLERGIALGWRWGAVGGAVASWFGYVGFVERVERRSRSLAPHASGPAARS